MEKRKRRRSSLAVGRAWEIGPAALTPNILGVPLRINTRSVSLQERYKVPVEVSLKQGKSTLHFGTVQ